VNGATGSSITGQRRGKRKLLTLPHDSGGPLLKLAEEMPGLDGTYCCVLDICGWGRRT